MDQIDQDTLREKKNRIKDYMRKVFKNEISKSRWDFIYCRKMDQIDQDTLRDKVTLEKGFQYSYCICTHVKTHTGENSLDCIEGGRKILQKSHLAKHIIIQEPRKLKCNSLNKVKITQLQFKGGKVVSTN